jgi:hypothetical protein
MKDLDTYAMSIKLAWIENVNPVPCSKPPRLFGLVPVRNFFVGHNILRLPERHFLLKFLVDQRIDVVLGLGYAVAGDLLRFGLAVLGVTLDSFLFVDDAIELVAHSSSLGLHLDLGAVDCSTAFRKWAQSVATLHRTRRVIAFTVDDLKAYSPILRNQSNSFPGTG